MTDNVQTAFRLPKKLVKEIDELVGRMRQVEPERQITRAEVARIALFRGLRDLRVDYFPEAKKKGGSTPKLTPAPKR